MLKFQAVAEKTGKKLWIWIGLCDSACFYCIVLLYAK